MMRVLDVPAGCGGFSLGALRAGCDVHGVELDADACETHRRNVGPCDLADMREYHPAGRFDVVIGGVPCQSFSLAGKRGGMRDPRGELYQHLVRIAVEAGARAVVLENVRGLLSWRDAETGASAIDTIEREMRAHGFAYVSRCVLNAKHYGVPQSRQRLFVVGFRAPVLFRWPAPTHGERGNVLGLPPYVTVREALGLGLGLGLGLSPLDAPSPCVTASEQKAALAFGSHGARTGARRAGDVLNPALAVLDRPCATIGAGGVDTGGAEPFRNPEYRAEFTKAMRALDKPSNTVLATEGHDGTRGSQGGTAVGGGAGYALGGRLTYRQCATLQGFPADFEFVGETVGSLYRQAGNAVPPALGEAVMRSVVAALATEGSEAA